MSEARRAAQALAGWIWVLGQAVLLFATALTGLSGPAWPPGLGWLLAPGLTFCVLGGGLALWGAATLGRSFSPLPRPHRKATLRAHGAYRLVRHPIYGGHVMLALGFALCTSGLALVPATLLAALFEGKRRREEAFLIAWYTEYASYRASVPRAFVPFVW